MDILRIIKPFCVQNNELYESMMKPYDGGDGYVYGCDNAMFIAVPDTTEGLPMGLTMFQNKAALHRPGCISDDCEPFSIPIKTIFEITRKFSETEKCDDCKGTGNVRYVFVDSNDEAHYKRLECPCCNGTGIVAGDLNVIHPDTQKPIKETVFLEITHGDTSLRFNIARIVRIAMTAKEFGLDALEAVNFGPRGAAVFKMPDGILVGLMPCMAGLASAKIRV